MKPFTLKWWIEICIDCILEVQRTREISLQYHKIGDIKKAEQWDEITERVRKIYVFSYNRIINKYGEK